MAFGDKNPSRANFLAAHGADTSRADRPPRDQLPEKLRALLDKMDRDLAALRTGGKAEVLEPGAPSSPPQPTSWQGCKARAGPTVPGTPRP